MPRRFRVSAALLPLAVLAGLLLGSVPAAAASPAGGLMEAFTFNDTFNHPGVTCYYGAVNAASQDLIKIVTKGPKVWARDRTGGVDHQTVAWRFVIEGAPAGVPPYTNEYSSSWIKATADDSSGHKFSARTWVQPKPAKNRQWKVHEELRFYKPGSTTTVEATIKFFNQYATSVYPPNPDTTNPAPCLPGM